MTKFHSTKIKGAANKAIYFVAEIVTKSEGELKKISKY